jgi:hypothetical protein
MPEAFDEIAAGALALGRGNTVTPQSGTVTPALLEDSAHPNRRSLSITPLPKPSILNLINVEATCAFPFKKFRVVHSPRPIDESLKGGREAAFFIITLSLLMVVR